MLYMAHTRLWVYIQSYMYIQLHRYTSLHTGRISVTGREQHLVTLCYHGYLFTMVTLSHYYSHIMQSFGDTVTVTN